MPSIKDIIPGGEGDMTKIVYDTNDDGTVDSADLATEATNVAGTPTPTQYYGTNAGGVKGFYDLVVSGGDVQSGEIEGSTFTTKGFDLGNIAALSRILVKEDALIKSIKLYNNTVSTQTVRLVSTIGALTFPFEAFDIPAEETVTVTPNHPLNYVSPDKMEIEIASGDVNFSVEYRDNNSDFIQQNLLADANLTDIYTCPASTETLLGYVKLINIDTVNPSQTVSFYVYKNSTSYLLEKHILTSGQSFEVPLSAGIHLETGDKIQLQCQYDMVVIFLSGTETTI